LTAEGEGELDPDASRAKNGGLCISNCLASPVEQEHLKKNTLFPEIGSSPHHFFRLANIGNLPHRETKEEMEASIMTVLAKGHRLNMELDLQRFLWAPVYTVHCTACTHWMRPRNSPLSPHLGY